MQNGFALRNKQAIIYKINYRNRNFLEFLDIFLKNKK